jgi:hypothetical protein
MSDDKKELPSTEYSLKSISWHLKCLVEEAKKISTALVKIMPKSDGEDCPF